MAEHTLAATSVSGPGAGAVAVVGAGAAPAGLSSLTQSIVSASIGAVLTSLLVTPFDVVKTRMQSAEIAQPSSPPLEPLTTQQPQQPAQQQQQPQQPAQQHSKRPVAAIRRYFSLDADVRPSRMSAFGSRLSQAASALSAREAAAGIDRLAVPGTLDGMVNIARTEGMPALWRGLTPTLIMSIPSTVIYYVGYDFLRTRLRAAFPKQGDAYAPLFAGAIARVFSATAISPIELVRTRMQAGDKGVGDIVKGVYGMTRIHGVGSLFRGLAPTLWRDVPFSALYWFGYESIKSRVSQYDEHGRLTNKFTASFTSGFVSGAVAAVVTHPFDVAKTIQQVAQASGPEHASAELAGIQSAVTPADPMNMRSVFRGVLEQSGWRGLFTGLTPRVIKVAPACAIMISSMCHAC
ncbi:mitochondrial carrier domain-containing protein [Entophlyctis helioformis]|nr:mitochondrial carrier domain-containing protein [Entophlyctis helioformis]